MKYRCVTNGFETTGYEIKNPDKERSITVKNGDVLDCEGDYIVKDGVSLCHKYSILGKYHFRKVEGRKNEQRICKAINS